MLAADADGDGRRDLLVFSGTEPGARTASVFRQGADRLETTPARAWVVDPDASFVDVTPAAGGADVVYTVPAGLRRYRLRAGDAGPPPSEPYWDGVTLLGGRVERGIHFFDFVRDWRGGGVETAAVVQPDRLLLLDRDPSAPPAIVRLRTTVDAVEPPQSVQFRPRHPLALAVAVPTLELRDWDGDGRPDLLAIAGDRLAVHLARDGGFAGDPDVHLTLSPAGDPRDETRHAVVQVDDVDGDGRLDAVRSTTSGGITRARQVTDVFRGTATGIPERPTVTREATGAAAQLILTDLDGDRHTEIIMASIGIGLPALVRMLLTRTLTVSYEVFQLGADARLVPAFAWSRPVAVNLAGPTEAPGLTLDADVDGDGIRDLVTTDADGELEVRRIVRGPGGLGLGERIATAPVPPLSQVVAVDLTGRGPRELVAYQPRPSGDTAAVVVLWTAP